PSPPAGSATGPWKPTPVAGWPGRTPGSASTRRQLTELDRARRLFEAIGDVCGRCLAHKDLAAAGQEMGRRADALVHAEHAVRLAESLGDTELRTTALNTAGYLHMLLDDLERALEYLQLALALCETRATRPPQ
ncbi:MAG TPA: tetratricopeptide repeat protein, partial [Micromonosporaceae bacterium]|nr:tetratricopeptide repeat protein [Micromonosporaceae bacterium]